MMIRLRAERISRGWSQMEVARRAEMHPSDISRYEGGRAQLYPGHRERLAAVFGVDDPEDLLEQVEIRLIR